MENIVNISPLVLKILAQRGVDSDEKLSKFISPSDQDFYDPYMLSGMEALAYRVRRAMQNREKILIFGDYDVDGVSATAVLCKYFESLKKLNQNKEIFNEANNIFCKIKDMISLTKRFQPKSSPFCEALVRGYWILIEQIESANIEIM